MEFTMRSTLSLSQYVKKRNGVPLGASHSIRNMLSRSFGAKSFPIFGSIGTPSGATTYPAMSCDR